MDIAEIGDLVLELCGTVLDESKGYLMETRLTPVLKEYGCQGFQELISKARMPSGQAVRQTIVDAITTQETLFFRDGSPFKGLKDEIIPEILHTKTNGLLPKRLRIWSAGCSTGQEPYSMAVVIDELKRRGSDDLDVKILATDISKEALNRAKKGIYARHEIERGLSVSVRDKYFEPVDGDRWRVCDELRQMVEFRPLNLLGEWGPVGRFDVIFCRNVAIYFDKTSRKMVFERFAEHLDEDAILFIGASESPFDLVHCFEPVRSGRAVYYKRRTKVAR